MRSFARIKVRGIPLWGWAAAAVLYVVAAASAAAFAWQRSIESIAEVGSHRLDLYAAALRSELGRYETVPGIVARQDSVRALLHAEPGAARAALLPEVNRYLEAVNGDTGGLAVDVIDRQGEVIAASNWNQALSFIGTNVSYRPYFLDALARGSGRFFGIGTNTGVPGLYFASAVLDAGKPAGAVAVKVSVDAFESAWRSPGEAAMVVDGNGVIVISTVPAWKFAALTPITPERQRQIEASKQYAGRAVALLPHQKLDRWSASARFARYPDWTRPGHDKRFLELSRPAPQAGDSLMVLLDVEPAMRQLRTAFAFVTALFMIAGLYALYATQRRRAIAEKLKGQDALREANDHLEATVAERTAELTAANAAMQREIAERARTEQELVHAGKLAVLGQMAAGLTHELNQPLGAIRTLSDNARSFLERNQQPLAIANLERISKLVDGMAVLTGELKTFARKSDVQPVAVSLDDAVAHALLIYEARLRDKDVQLDVRIPAGTTVWAEPSQLQQVLVNLLGNALDAVADEPQRSIAIEAHDADQPGRVLFSIADSGTGIAPEVLPHLFEPFVTTKPRGRGLGLGLAITSRLVLGFGARIFASNRPDGGAQFTIEFMSMTETGVVDG
ncbi:sensor histidine kinase [Trinickia terrae]|uniref:C4-dicarboxylate transport sensor protein DctB n=1 Tax=Trinickia terrae TaxID=2571161 RepID=A0A4U1I8M6_9BURK|nr:ATP-binding protein [Trinickia terrae]TKC89798.1 sensor histidine kinase [Trinickia terrae]